MIAILDQRQHNIVAGKSRYKFDRMSDITKLEKDILANVAAAKNEAALEAVRIAALGKNGTVSALLKTLGTMSTDERKTQGPAINGLKDRVSESIAQRKDALGAAALDARLNTETVDVTLPVREAPAETGRIHPISQVTDELTAIFADMSTASARVGRPHNGNTGTIPVPESWRSR